MPASWAVCSKKRTPDNGTWLISDVTMAARWRTTEPNSNSIFAPSSRAVEAGAMTMVRSPPGDEKMWLMLVV